MEDTFVTNIILPYIRGTIDKIAKILRRRNIKFSFSPSNSLRNMLDSTKDPIDMKLQKGVYTIPCSCGKKYIGEIGRSIRIRLKEHTNHAHHEQIKKYSIVEHCYNMKHYMCFENA